MRKWTIFRKDWKDLIWRNLGSLSIIYGQVLLLWKTPYFLIKLSCESKKRKSLYPLHNKSPIAEKLQQEQQNQEIREKWIKK